MKEMWSNSLGLDLPLPLNFFPDPGLFLIPIGVLAACDPSKVEGPVRFWDGEFKYSHDEKPLFMISWMFDQHL